MQLFWGDHLNGKIKYRGKPYTKMTARLRGRKALTDWVKGKASEKPLD